MPRLPLSRSQYRWAPIDHRTFSQNVVMAAPRMTNPTYSGGAPIDWYENANADTDKTGRSVSWNSQVRLRNIHTARGYARARAAWTKSVSALRIRPLRVVDPVADELDERLFQRRLNLLERQNLPPARGDPLHHRPDGRLLGERHLEFDRRRRL